MKRRTSKAVLTALREELIPEAITAPQDPSHAYREGARMGMRMTAIEVLERAGVPIERHATKPPKVPPHWRVMIALMLAHEESRAHSLRHGSRSWRDHAPPWTHILARLGRTQTEESLEATFRMGGTPALKALVRAASDAVKKGHAL